MFLFFFLLGLIGCISCKLAAHVDNPVLLIFLLSLGLWQAHVHLNTPTREFSRELRWVEEGGRGRVEIAWKKNFLPPSRGSSMSEMESLRQICDG